MILARMQVRNVTADRTAVTVRNVTADRTTVTVGNRTQMQERQANTAVCIRYSSQMNFLLCDDQLSGPLSGSVGL